MAARDASSCVEIKVLLWRLHYGSVGGLEGDIEEEGAGAGVVALNDLYRLPREEIRGELAITLIGDLAVVMPVIALHILEIIRCDRDNFYLEDTHLRSLREVSVVHHPVVIINSMSPGPKMRVKP